MQSYLVFFFFLLCACDHTTISTASQLTTYVIQMDQDYDDTEPFTNALLFYAVKDIDTIKLSGQLHMECEIGTLQVMQRSSREVLWEKTWKSKNDSTFTIPLKHLQKDEEYTIQFRATGVSEVNLSITTDEALFIERTKPKNK